MIYIGVSESGAYAVIDGNQAEVRSSGKDMLPVMKKLNGKNTRCVIESSNPGYETTSLNKSAAEQMYLYCNLRKIPYMFVKPGSWKRDMNIDKNAVEVCKKLYPFTGIEIRADGSSPEADALLLAVYAKRSL